MAAVIVFHIFDGGHELLPIVVIAIFKLCDFLISFDSSYGCNNHVELLKLLESHRGEVVYCLLIVLVQLLLIEDKLIVGLVKSKLAVSGLIFSICLAV